MSVRQIFLGLLRRTFSGLEHFIKWTLLLAAFAVASAIYWASELADMVVENIYANVERPDIGETPPTFTAFLPGPRIISILGGKGEGLNCSIPPIAAPAFGRPGKRVDQAPIELRFRQACVMHDLCYRHGLATYAYTQADCDYMLQEQLFQVCNLLLGPDCRQSAMKMLLGVRLGGTGSYQDAEHSTYFEYDPFPLHAIEFTYARSIESPNSGKEILITFQSKPSGLTAIEAGGKPQQVWMPQSYYMTAPHHIMAADGYSKLVWPMRQSTDSTKMCLIQRNHRELYNVPTRDNGLFSCERSKVQTPIDLHSSSPVIVTGAGSRVTAAGPTNVTPPARSAIRSVPRWS